MRYAPRKESARPEHVLQCRACRGFMGYIANPRTAFCRDIVCVATREWVWDDEDVLDMVDFLFREGLTQAHIAELYGVEPYVIGNCINRRKKRKLYAAG